MVLAHDEVDHAGDRIAAVNSRSTVLQHFDALDRSKGNRRQIHTFGAIDRATEGPHALAVHQHQRGLPAQAAQRRGLVAECERADDVAERNVTGAVVRGDEIHDLHRVLRATAVDLFATDRLHRQRALALDPLDVRAGNVDLDVCGHARICANGVQPGNGTGQQQRPILDALRDHAVIPPKN